MDIANSRLHLKGYRKIMTNLEAELDSINTQIRDNNINDLNHVLFHRKQTILRQHSTAYAFILRVKDDLYNISRS